ncbi:hypothetical protein [Pseudomonas sp. CCC3.1]|uniref:hypothetical protein n=1 Tax=Pseudomonas sp. CCC3.1 TaxID=3048607 RepID=UPI002AC9D1CC|nr:hypothetical protein [Pseudomonas sp. CCC3.1]MEB0207655.1 hypothetical protein [Pseudomonas sp. CCC3.1]WPX35733.1 hypothetical protein RHM56_21010 [Pseudomonas sp. CCC3.1]
MKPSTATDLSPNALYTVAVPKFLLLYLMTGGVYLFYWSYRNWAAYKKNTGAAITPLVRGLFWPFFILDLFDKVHIGLAMQGRSYKHSLEIRALLIMLLVMFIVLLFTFFDRPSDAHFVYVADAVLIVCGGFLFVGAQRAINVLAGDARGLSNSLMAWSNYAWMCLGCAGWLALMRYFPFA